MKHYNHILLPTVLIKQSLDIGLRAAHFAKQANAKLSLLHVIEPEFKFRFLKASTETIDRELINTRKGQLAELGKALCVPESDQYLRVGIPKYHIQNVAQQIKSDLIVIARHAHHNNANVLGSTAIAVAHTAPCDVLTIRVDGSANRNYQHILLPISLTEHSIVVAERISSFANNSGIKLSFLHVVDPVPGYGFGAVSPDQIYGQLATDARKRLAEIGMQNNISMQHQYLKSGKPETQILKTADELAADLIIVACYRHHNIFRLLGSTAITIVNKALCDILTVRLAKTETLVVPNIDSNSTTYLRSTAS